MPLLSSPCTNLVLPSPPSYCLIGKSGTRSAPNRKLISPFKTSSHIILLLHVHPLHQVHDAFYLALVMNHRSLHCYKFLSPTLCAWHNLDPCNLFVTSGPFFLYVTYFWPLHSLVPCTLCYSFDFCTYRWPLHSLYCSVCPNRRMVM